MEEEPRHGLGGRLPAAVEPLASAAMNDEIRIRREPPPFRRVTVVQAEQPTRWLRRITLGGPEFSGMDVADLAASVRLLLPGPAGLVMPSWAGNEFLLPDGMRPVLRTMTPRFQWSDALAIDVVLHETGAASDWARKVAPGSEVALSGPGRGSAPDPGSGPLLIAGDESAVPAIAQLLENLPARDRIDVLIETDHADDPAPLPQRPDTSIAWLMQSAGTPPGTALVGAVQEADLSGDVRIWAAGEAAAMQRIRRHLAECEIPRPQTTVRGYWKHGKVAGGATG